VVDGSHDGESLSFAPRELLAEEVDVAWEQVAGLKRRLRELREKTDQTIWEVRTEFAYLRPNPSEAGEGVFAAGRRRKLAEVVVEQREVRDDFLRQCRSLKIVLREIADHLDHEVALRTESEACE